MKLSGNSLQALVIKIAAIQGRGVYTNNGMTMKTTRATKMAFRN